ncbi:hypothetical protein T439DRAFT_332100 [Meredithblackwellia eburnea MCA 4105]
MSAWLSCVGLPTHACYMHPRRVDRDAGERRTLTARGERGCRHFATAPGTHSTVMQTQEGLQLSSSDKELLLRDLTPCEARNIIRLPLEQSIRHPNALNEYNAQYASARGEPDSDLAIVSKVLVGRWVLLIHLTRILNECKEKYTNELKEEKLEVEKEICILEKQLRVVKEEAARTKTPEEKRRQEEDMDFLLKNLTADESAKMRQLPLEELVCNPNDFDTDYKLILGVPQSDRALVSKSLVGRRVLLRHHDKKLKYFVVEAETLRKEIRKLEVILESLELEGKSGFTAMHSIGAEPKNHRVTRAIADDAHLDDHRQRLARLYADTIAQDVQYLTELQNPAQCEFLVMLSNENPRKFYTEYIKKFQPAPSSVEDLFAKLVMYRLSLVQARTRRQQGDFTSSEDPQIYVKDLKKSLQGNAFCDSSHKTYSLNDVLGKSLENMHARTMIFYNQVTGRQFYVQGGQILYLPGSNANAIGHGHDQRVNHHRERLGKLYAASLLHDANCKI